MAKRKRPGKTEKPETSDYVDDEGNVLTLRQSLSPGTIRKIAKVSGKAGASSEDVWQRRSEMLFERLAVRWEIAGRIVMAWIVTIPTCLILGWAMYRLLHLITGVR